MPFCVWQLLQPPSVWGLTIARSFPVFVSTIFAVNGVAMDVLTSKLPTLLIGMFVTLPFLSVMTTVIPPLAPLQSFGSCPLGNTVPAIVNVWQFRQFSPGRIVAPLTPDQRWLLVHFDGAVSGSEPVVPVVVPPVDPVVVPEVEPVVVPVVKPVLPPPVVPRKPPSRVNPVVAPASRPPEVPPTPASSMAPVVNPPVPVVFAPVFVPPLIVPPVPPPIADPVVVLEPNPVVELGPAVPPESVVRPALVEKLPPLVVLSVEPFVP